MQMDSVKLPSTTMNPHHQQGMFITNDVNGGKVHKGELMMPRAAAAAARYTKSLSVYSLTSLDSPHTTGYFGTSLSSQSLGYGTDKANPR